MEHKEFVFSTVTKFENPIVRDHTVHGVRLIPGTTHLDLVTRILLAKGFDPDRISIRKMLFQRAVAAAEDFSRRVRYTFTPQKDYWLIRGESRKEFSGKVLDPEWELNLTAEFHLTEPRQTRKVDLDALRREGTRKADLEDIYANARAGQIIHGPFMKGFGQAHISDKGLLADLALGEEAKAHLKSFYFHPALLDCSTVLPFLFAKDQVDSETETSAEGEGSAYIPFLVGDFRFNRGFGDRVSVLMTLRTKEIGKDITTSDIEFFDVNGNSVGEIKGMTAKRIRFSNSIVALEGEGEAPAAEAAAPPAMQDFPVAAAVSTEGELGDVIRADLRAMVGAMLETEPDNVPMEEGFYDMGLDSTALLGLVQQMEGKLEEKLYPTLLFEYTTIEELAEYLEEEFGERYRDAVARGGAPMALPEPGEHGFLHLKMQAFDAPLAKRDLLPGTLLVMAQNKAQFEKIAAQVPSPLKTYGVLLGEAFAQAGNCFTLGTKSEADVQKLFEALKTVGDQPRYLLHATNWEDAQGGLMTLNASLDRGFYSLLLMLREFANRFAGQPLRAVSVYKGKTPGASPLISALNGFAGTVSAESPKINLNAVALASEDWAAVINELGDDQQGVRDVIYADGNRSMRMAQDFSLDEAASSTHIRQSGSYVITGGAGGLGRVFAEWLATDYKARLVLCGRSSASDKTAALIADIEKLGGQAIYVAADIGDAASTKAMFDLARETYGEVHGLIHTAGIVRDAFLTNKTLADAEAVLSAKVQGTLNLHEASKTLALDFFMTCSSVAGLLGNAGQCDYAYANAFMDRFAQWRELERLAGNCRGNTVSVNWPIWADGGMQIDENAMKAMSAATGMMPLSKQGGVDFVAKVVGLPAGNYAILEGDPNRIRQTVVSEPPVAQVAAPKTEPVRAVPKPQAPKASKPPKVESVSAPLTGKTQEYEHDDIAIVGLAGRYPKANNLSEFWQNLVTGRDCIEPIPETRWMHEPYYDPQKGVYAKTNCRWGGFIEHPEFFDPLFFNLNPREMQFADPQERLFLMTAWEAMEDAGYTRKSLKPYKTGVYCGVMWQDYFMIGLPEALAGEAPNGRALPSSIPNRVSFVMDLKGPSMAVDTMCSSALTALTIAHRSLLLGEIDAAFVGGVNITIHPNKYLQLSLPGLLSSNGQCRSFGEGGDGYVPAEGVGVALIKRLSQAMADGDHIYGVIKSTALNHSGKAGGFTVPSPVGQGDLMKHTLERETIDPATISYVEAHGTGTELGDSIEFAAFTRAFRSVKNRDKKVAMGSVKSNMGHSESASVMAGLSKILLQMKHNKLVPSLHCETLNPQIDFANSPFEIQRELGEWQPQVDVQDGHQIPVPRRASLNSFGAGGSNGHIVIEEFIETAAATDDGSEMLLVLSARNEKRLRAYAAKLADFIENSDAADLPTLERMAYTLQVGREAFEARSAFAATSLSEAAKQFRAFGQNGAASDVLFHETEESLKGPELREQKSKVKAAIEANDWRQLQALWVQGADVDWNAMYGEQKPHKVSLPTYPFLQQAYWVPSLEPLAAFGQTVFARETEAAPLHPLLDQNCGTFYELAFAKKINANDDLVADNRLQGQPAFPFAGILEMARAAGSIAAESGITRIQDVVCYQPLVIDGDGKLLRIALQPGQAGASFEIYADQGDLRQVFAQGQLRWHDTLAQPADLDLAAVRERCSQHLDQAGISQRGHEEGWDYGPYYEIIQSAAMGDGEALVEVALPTGPESEAFVLHPSLLSAALRACLLFSPKEHQGVYVPQRLDGLSWFATLPERLWIHLAQGNGEAFKITISDETGRVVANADGFKFTTFAAQTEQEAAEAPSETAELIASFDDVYEAALNYLQGMMAEILNMDASEVRAKASFDRYGIDSIAIMQMNQHMEEKFDGVPSTLFFEYDNLHDVSVFLAEEHSESMVKALDLASAETTAKPVSAPAQSTAVLKAKSRAFAPRLSQTASVTPTRALSAGRSQRIAIIGVAGRYPGARTLDGLWELLRKGESAITRVPESRWRSELFYDPKPGMPGKTPMEYGGFIEGVADFDPLHFNISPMEACFMDPQERLFMESVWHALEDAGYNRAALTELQKKAAGVGVFVACQYRHYPMLSNSEAFTPRHSVNSFASLANRVSYFYNFAGPSIAIDTACSGGLTAVHLACESLKTGASSVAVAGGVNLTLHPYKYIGLGELGLIGTTPESRSFGEGDGMVPGEGVGTLILKPLEAAVADGDHIHGVIAATGINHGGKTSGFAMPNPKMQAKLINDTLTNAGIDAASIGYIEAAATGSPVSDPIEHAGLSRAFAGAVSEDRKIPVGSVKSNVGHLEAASGMSQISKVLLQMKHHTLAPSINAANSPTQINWERSPLALQKTLSRWEAHGDQPLRAAVSSFGAGGSNAHIILESYAAPSGSPASDEAQLLVFSGRNKARLKATLEAMADHFDAHVDLSLVDVAYTLFVGREWMKERVAFIAKDVTQLVGAMRRYLVGENNVQGCYTGDNSDMGSFLDALLEGKAGQAFLQALLQERDFDKLARLWITGSDLPVDLLFADKEPRRVSLPGYVFEARPCWLPDIKDFANVDSSDFLFDPSSASDMPGVDFEDLGQKRDEAADAPRTETESVLAEIWRQILGVDRVGIHDNFLELGGHSLLATQVISAIRQHLGFEVTAKQMFEKPTIAELAELLADSKGAVRQAAGRIQPVSRERELPLSFSQQRLWVFDQMDPGNPAYNVAFAFRIQGDFRAEPLEKSVNLLVERHESLRTTFEAHQGEARQVIHNKVQIPLERGSVAHLPEAKRMDALLDLLNEHAWKPFDLATGPLVRAHFFEIDEEDQAVLLVFHHIVSDGWSVGVTIGELIQIYMAVADDKKPQLPELPIQYADFATWQREYWEPNQMAKQLAYWKANLEDANFQLELPTDFPRPPIKKTLEGAIVPFYCPDELRDRLHAFCVKQGVTPFMTLLAALNILLSRYSGQRDILVGSSIANRNMGELEGLIGFFVNSLVYRTDLTGNPTCLELLKQVQENTLNAYANQELSFEKLVEELKMERDRSRSPIYQVGLTVQNAPSLMLKDTGLKAEFLDFESPIARWDLNFDVREQQDGMVVRVEYDKALFRNETIERMMQHFFILLDAFVSKPQQAIADIHFISDDERHQLVDAWNDNPADYSNKELIHQIFEQNAGKFPDRTALADPDTSIAYGLLNARANQLAHHLRSEYKVGPDVLVGICMGRSIENIVALLAILKAGGGYVPMDEHHPADRLALIAKDASMPVMLSKRAHEGELPHEVVPVIYLDGSSAEEATGLWAEVAEQPQKAPQIGNLSRHNLAYAIYTSGSTGTPKGVMLEHAQVLNYTLGAMNRLKVEEGLSYALVSTFAADLGNTSIFGSFALGGTLHILPPNVSASPEGMERYVSENKIDVIKIVPSHLRALLEGENPTYILPQKILVMGGEACTADLVAQLQDWGVSERLYNHYGPSEATVGVTAYPIDHVVHADDGVIPLGRPFGNIQLYVLDGNLNLLPVGLPGELCIAGDSLARGYLNRPEQTAERFVPNPYSKTPGARMYRTGDLVRYRADGNVMFIGRIDHQVKIRGYRIELGEIDAALTAFEGIQSTVVMVREPSPNDKRLVAYLLAPSLVEPDPSGDGFSGPTEDLQTFLEERLPDYMIPAALVWMDRFPLNANGKLNRRAFPEPKFGRSGVAAAYVAPRNETESVLAELWQGILGVDQVGVFDNFFKLGGHSLLAIRVVSGVRQHLGLEITPGVVFDRPTVSALAAMLDGEGQAAIKPAEVIPQVSRNREIPLSFAQQRLWFFDQMEPGNASYNTAGSFRIKGEFKGDLLEKAINKLVLRHEGLRTTFADNEGTPIQVIHKTMPIRVSQVSLTHYPEDARIEALQELIAESAWEPFDLKTGPLFRVSLFEIDENDQVLLVVFHHIISDGWSVGVTIGELIAFYESILLDQPVQLPELPIQYADFAIWQREIWAPREMENQLVYWKENLAGANFQLDLPTDFPRPRTKGLEGALARFTIEPELNKRLRDFCLERGVTPFMTLLSVVNVLLARWSGQRDILIGSASANRNMGELESLIGFFVNTLVIRTDLGDNPTCMELLAQVQQNTLNAYANPDVSFEKLVEELKPERDTSRSPIYQVAFTMQNTPSTDVNETGLQTEVFEVDRPIARWDLLFDMREVGGVLEGMIEYDTALFMPATMERMVDHFLMLLDGFLRKPSRKVFELNMLNDHERNTIVREWNDTMFDYPRELSIPELFQAQVEKTPARVALEFGDDHTTYEELNKRGNKLARQLQKHGVARGQRVGVFMDRSPEMVVTMLAILKAGAAYVPLDPEYPADRLHYMLGDAHLAAMVSKHALADDLPEMQTPVIFIDDAKLSGEVSDDNLAATCDGLDAAYVMYTSGSTGKPKGTVIPHCGVTRLVLNTNYIDLAKEKRVAQAANMVFDAATFEIWGPLLHGGQMVNVPKEAALETAQMYDYLRDKNIEVLFLTTALFNQHVRDRGDIFAPLKTVLFGGEAVDPQWVRKLKQEGAPDRLLHVYGPTETTTFASWYPVDVVDEGAGTVPIGYPIGNTEIYLLDQYGSLQPMGIPGELCIGGDGLAQIYFNRPELTATKFVPDAFSGRPGARLYRTGDLVKQLGDGAIVFIGRIDNQIKLRGFRVELGEIETALRHHPAVEDALVLARKDEAGTLQLAAYIHTKSAEKSSLSVDLRGFLSSSLPDYMIPTYFVVMDEFPLNANGKVDRRALPEPKREVAEDDSNYRAPRSTAEKALGEIWQGLLNVERVGLDDNFFELGGHSLLATRLTTQIRNRFRVEIPIRLLFEKATLEALADEIVNRLMNNMTLPPEDQASNEEKETIEIIDRNQAIPLHYPQQRLWFIDQLEPNNPAYNITGGVRIKGQLNRELVEKALNVMVDRHETLRTTFAAPDGEPQQVIAAKLEIPLTPVDLRGEADVEKALQRACTDEARTPFNLAEGPLFRAKFIQISDDEAALLVNMHHIISDGWSLGVLIRELWMVIDDLMEERASTLPPLPVQYADYVVWHRQIMEDGEMERQHKYWMDQLAGCNDVLDIPTDFQRSTAATFLGRGIDFKVPAALTRKLYELGRSEDATLFMVMMTGFSMLMARYSGQEDLLVGTPSANRNRQETELMIGFFINTLAIRANFETRPTVREAIRSMRQTALDAFAHNEYPFEKLVEELIEERDLSRNPLVQVMLSYQNHPMPVMSSDEIEVTDLDFDSGITRNEMILHLTENQEDGLDGHLIYSQDLFADASMRRLVDHFLHMLEAMVAEPDRDALDLEFMGEEETNKVLYEWNHTRTEYPKTFSVLETYESQAAKRANQVALADENGSMTYAMLNGRANQLAHKLRSLGVGPDVLVGICMESRLEVIVAVLAILKAGGGYVPMDHKHPKDRLALIAEDSEMPVLLSHQSLADGLPTEQVKVLFLDEAAAESATGLWQDLANQPATKPSVPDADPHNLAYAIYTSGSTGMPKGVMIEHAQLLNYTLGAMRRLQVPEGLTYALVSTFAADLGNTSIYGSLLLGGTLHVLGMETATLGENIGAYVQKNNVDFIKIVPSHLRALLNCDDPKAVLPAKYLVMGGEACTAELVQEVQELGVADRLFNHYGPSEATVGVTAYSIDREVKDSESVLPLGRPFGNIQLYVVDAQMRPLPVGFPGELCIAGDSTARGYLKRPHLTAERFVPDPFGSKPGGRMYRTGDLVRYLPDGNVMFLGRIDHQVKIRGYRIELGEIEAEISAMEGVDGCVVMAKPHQNEMRIVAWIGAKDVADDAGGKQALLDKVRAKLGERLPEYMMPSAFMVLEAIPLNPNGKIDRKSLPEPEFGEIAVGEFVAPRNDVEKEIVGAYQHLLGIERVGVHDNFFKLGGHSLLAARMLAHLRKTFSVEVSPRTMFEKPTPAELAEVIEVAQFMAGQDEASTEAESEAPAEIVAAAVEEGSFDEGSLDDDMEEGSLEEDFEEGSLDEDEVEEGSLDDDFEEGSLDDEEDRVTAKSGSYSAKTDDYEEGEL